MPRNKSRPSFPSDRSSVADVQQRTVRLQNGFAIVNGNEDEGSPTHRFSKQAQFAHEKQLHEETAAVERLISSLELRLNRSTIEAMLPAQRRRIELLFRRWRAMTVVVMEEIKSKH